MIVSRSELRAICGLLFGSQFQFRIWLKTLYIPDHARILKLGSDSHFPIVNRLFGGDTAELHQRGGRYRSGCMNTVPAMDENRLTLGFDRLVYLLMYDRTPLAFPTFVAVVKVAFRAVNYRRTMESGAIEIVGGPHALRRKEPRAHSD